MNEALTIEDAALLVRTRRTSSAELVKRSLRAADRHDEDLGVFLSRFDDAALTAAEAADAAVASGKPLGPLHGVPIGVKDLLSTVEGPTTAQSRVLDGAWSDGDATVVARLRAAGALVVGKTTLMELAYATPYFSDPFPMPANPWDPRRWPGGSSSGSASGVVAGMMLAALGTDTGGSVRVPAAMCGISGIKPTFGLVPMAGCVPLSFSQDHIGPMASTARDCAIMLDVMADRPVAPVPDIDLGGLRIGVDRLSRITGDDGDPAVPGLLDRALAELAGLGAELVEVELPWYPEVIDASFLTVAAERLAYHMPNLPEKWSDYGYSARLGMARGAYYSAADYVQAQRVRRAAQRKVAGLFERVDVIASPMSARPAPLRTEIEECMRTWKQLVHAPYWDALGNPALSVPMGFNGDGLPMGLQVVGRPYADAEVLRVGQAYQSVTDWHTRRPRGM